MEKPEKRVNLYEFFILTGFGSGDFQAIQLFSHLQDELWIDYQGLGRVLQERKIENSHLLNLVQFADLILDRVEIDLEGLAARVSKIQEENRNSQ